MDKPINNNWPKYPGEDSVFIREATEQELKDDTDNKTGGIQSWYTKKELTKKIITSYICIHKVYFT